MQDEILIGRLKRRDMNAFEEVIGTYKNYVGAIVKSRISASMQPEDVEEVVADVFFALWKQSGKLDAKKGSLKNYLGILTRNRYIKVSGYRDFHKISYRRRNSKNDSQGYANESEYC